MIRTKQDSANSKEASANKMRSSMTCQRKREKMKVLYGDLRRSDWYFPLQKDFSFWYFSFLGVVDCKGFLRREESSTRLACEILKEDG